MQYHINGELCTQREWAQDQLDKVRELKARLAWQQCMPKPCSTPKCGFAGYAGNNERVSIVDGPHYKAGQHHPVCSACRNAENNDSKIRILKSDLGIK